MLTQTTYIGYLLSTPTNYTCTHLAAHLSDVSHDQVNRFLCVSALPANQLRELIAPLLRDSPEVFLLVDDSVQDKRYNCLIGGQAPVLGQRARHGHRHRAGSEKCPCRKATAQRNHLTGCCLALVSLRQHARQMGQTTYQAHQQQWAPYLRQLLQKPII